MKNSLVGTIISIIVLFISLIVLPTYFQGVIQYRNDLNTVQVATRDFMDRVIDSRQISEDAEKDLALSLASCSSTWNYKIYHEIKQVNPSNGGTYVTNWVYTSDLTTFHTGDIVTVVCEQKNLSLFQRLSGSFLGTSYNREVVRFSAMVR